MFIELKRRTGARAFVAPAQIAALTDARVRESAMVTLTTGETFEVVESVDQITTLLQEAAQVQFEADFINQVNTIEHRRPSVGEQVAARRLVADNEARQHTRVQELGL